MKKKRGKITPYQGDQLSLFEVSDYASEATVRSEFPCQSRYHFMLGSKPCYSSSGDRQERQLYAKAHLLDSGAFKSGGPRLERGQEAENVGADSNGQKTIFDL